MINYETFSVYIYSDANTAYFDPLLGAPFRRIRRYFSYLLCKTSFGDACVVIWHSCTCITNLRTKYEVVEIE